MESGAPDKEKTMAFFKKLFCVEKENKKYGIPDDTQYLVFENGQMKKVVPKETENDGWYDAKYIVSDGKPYNLEDVKSVLSIKVPAFSLSDCMSGYGVTGSLDYVIRMKAGNLQNRKEYELCSACLWKSTELMFSNYYGGWDEEAFYRIVQYHIEMGMFEEAEKAEKYVYDNLKDTLYYKEVLPEIKKNPAYIDKHNKFLKTNELRKEYYYIFYNFHDISPKSFSGYSRMKNGKTKKFEELKLRLKERGFIIKE